MPLYVYEVVLPDGSGGDQFEVLQKMSDEPLTAHPVTGARRSAELIGEPNAPRTWTDSQGKGKLSDKSLAAKGFHQVRQDRRRPLRKDHGEGAQADPQEVEITPSPTAAVRGARRSRLSPTHSRTARMRNRRGRGHRPRIPTSVCSSISF